MLTSADGDRETLERLFKALSKNRTTFALAESCTGGLASSLLTDIPGISRYFKGGIVAYSNDVKVSSLGVSGSTIRKYGAVSSRTALEMAEGARVLMGSDTAAAITGIAGPRGARPGKPVGLAYIAFAKEGKSVVKRIIRRGDRRALKREFTEALLNLAVRNIQVT